MVAATTREVAARREFLVTKVMAQCCCYGATELGWTLVAFASCEEVWRPTDALFVKTKNQAFRILHGRYHTFRMKAMQVKSHGVEVWTSDGKGWEGSAPEKSGWLVERE